MPSFIKNIQNRHFKKIFLKNWLTVFLSIVLPLTACVLFVHYNNQRTLLDEIDVSAQRSTLNVTSTLETLFQEACDTLEREVLDQNTSLFFSAKPSFPPPYSFITLVNQMKTRINADYHDSLYYSLDCYSASCNFLVSTTFQGQFYQWVDDNSLTDAFSRYRSVYPDALLFAVRREALDADVITIYRSQPFPSYQDSFVSISIDPQTPSGSQSLSPLSLSSAHSSHPPVSRRRPASVRRKIAGTFSPFPRGLTSYPLPFP